jgi:hypothetical protein
MLASGPHSGGFAEEKAMTALFGLKNNDTAYLIIAQR